MALRDLPEELRDCLMKVLRVLLALEHPRRNDDGKTDVAPRAGHPKRVLSRDCLGGERGLDNQRVAQESSYEAALAASQHHARTPRRHLPEGMRHPGEKVPAVEAGTPGRT